MPDFSSFGDMARAYSMNRYSTEIKQQISRLSAELSSGKVQDIAAHLGGEYAPATSLDRSLSSLAAWENTNAEAALFASSAQNTLGVVQGLISESAPNLLMASDSGHQNMLTPATADARQKFFSAVSAMNTQIAGRGLFSGAATDQISLAEGDTILTALQTAIAAETTAAGVQGVVDTWFAPGGGFDTVAYQGSTNDLAPFSIGQHETTTLQVRADDSAVRNTLKGFALAALVHDGALATDLQEQVSLVAAAGETLISAEAALLDVRARIGISEAQIEQASVRNKTEMAALEIARAGLLEVDPFETATELQTAQNQLETLYTLTAHLSRLSLTDYL